MGITCNLIVTKDHSAKRKHAQKQLGTLHKLSCNHHANLLDTVSNSVEITLGDNYIVIENDNNVPKNWQSTITGLDWWTAGLDWTGLDSDDVIKKLIVIDHCAHALQ